MRGERKEKRDNHPHFPLLTKKLVSVSKKKCTRELYNENNREAKKCGRERATDRISR